MRLGGGGRWKIVRRRMDKLAYESVIAPHMKIVFDMAVGPDEEFTPQLT